MLGMSIRRCASKCRPVARAWLTDGVGMIFIALSVLALVTIAVFDAATIPALLLLCAAGMAAVCLGHVCGREKLQWMDADAIQLVDKQVFRHFALGCCGVTALASIAELIISLIGALIAAVLIGLDPSTIQKVAKSMEDNQKHEPTFGAILAVFFIAFVVAAGTEEAGKAWGVRCAQLRRCCAVCSSTQGTQTTQTTGSSGLLPPTPPRTASATATARPSTATSGENAATPSRRGAQQLEKNTCVLQPTPHVPRVTIALFVAVAAGFSTAENMGYVFGNELALAQQPAADPPVQDAVLMPTASYIVRPMMHPLLRHLQQWTSATPHRSPDSPGVRHLAEPGDPIEYIADPRSSAQRTGDMLLFACARVALSLPLHVLCAVLTAFAYLEVDVHVAGGGTPPRNAWFKGMSQGVLLHGIFDCVLILLALFLPGRVPGLWAELLPIIAAAAMMIAGAVWTARRWKRDIQPLLQAYEAPLGVVGLQGGYAQLDTAAAPEGGDDADEGGVELTDV